MVGSAECHVGDRPDGGSLSYPKPYCNLAALAVEYNFTSFCKFAAIIIYSEEVLGVKVHLQ